MSESFSSSRPAQRICEKSKEENRMAITKNIAEKKKGVQGAKNIADILTCSYRPVLFRVLRTSSVLSIREFELRLF